MRARSLLLLLTLASACSTQSTVHPTTGTASAAGTSGKPRRGHCARTAAFPNRP